MADTRVEDDALTPNDTARVQRDLLRVAHMFGEYRDDVLMRELCRLAIKCTQERLISARSS